jgi:putative ABC transport system permease protein
VTGRIPIAWLQLSAEKLRLLAAVAGIAFAAMLMLMQLGFRDALLASATLVHERLAGEIVMISPLYEYLISTRSFPEHRLERALGVEGVRSVAPILVSVAAWKNPVTGREHKINLIGVRVGTDAFELTEVVDQLHEAQIPDAVLADASARPEFGPVAEWFGSRGVVRTEINGHRIKVKGLFHLGTGFGVNGTIIASDMTFRRLIPSRRARMIDIGIVRLAPGVAVEPVRRAIVAALPPDVQVLTRDEFIDFEQTYWLRNSPVGFIFNLGTFMGFIVGAVIVYQILYSDVSDHLPEYATLKAMGYGDMRLFGIVVRQALILAVLGYVPGYLIAQGLYVVTQRATFLPIAMTPARVAFVFAMTVAMCAGSAVLAMRKLRAADPAEIF